jgi:predicted nucleic acid-binding protein
VAIGGWLLDKSAAARMADASIRAQVQGLTGSLFLCAMGELEQLYSARSASDYDALKRKLHDSLEILVPPFDIFDRALALQRDLAHHHGMWHRTAIPDLLIAETALHHGVGVVHVDRDYDRIAELRPLTTRRLQ